MVFAAAESKSRSQRRMSMTLAPEHRASFFERLFIQNTAERSR